MRYLPADEPTPPFIIVCDVGHSFEVYADFTQAGKAYLPFPDPRSFRIRLTDLANEEVRERLRLIWTNPAALDPAKVSADVTRQIAGYLAELAKSLEQSGHDPKVVAQFLTRCLFCMFAEDVGLLPERCFTELLDSLDKDGTGFVSIVGTLFREMNTGTKGDISVVLRKKLLRFNGGLFADHTVLPVNGLQLGLLKQASKTNWKNVEPAIFGTLLERALVPEERHALGAHFTPRAYVERLVLPTLVNPLREEWESIRAAAVTLANSGKLKDARHTIEQFHDHLCTVTVLDPACGSGNFLYVALEHLKRLEGEVLDFAAQFGVDMRLDIATHTVDPHQFLGIELNPRAAAIAELVLWIGYLQWHFRTRGQTMPEEPVLKRFKNIECRDAVLAYEGDPQPARDEAGHVITVWDRRSQKTDLVTNRNVPDESKRVPLLTYANPRPASWPSADYIIGNPPFIGKVKLREDLGDGYAETLRAAYPDVPDSADFVLYWWHKAAELVRAGKARRFGLITTNSLRQTFARRVVQHHLSGTMSRGTTPRSSHAALQNHGAAAPGSTRVSRAASGVSPEAMGLSKDGETVEAQGRSSSRRDAETDTRDACGPLSLVFAIPDHPWVDSAEGAAVRIAMTVAAAGEHPGDLLEVADEDEIQDDGTSTVTFQPAKQGRISADLTVGADVVTATPLMANHGLANPGVQLSGQGFVLSTDDVEKLSAKTRSDLVRRYVTGRDLMQERREQWVLDTFGLTIEQLLTVYPDAYQRLNDLVRPERLTNPREKYRSEWWIHAEPRGRFRAALKGLSRFVVTSRTSRHRVFQFLGLDYLPESKVVILAFADAFELGILSSRAQVVFATTAGGWLGVGNDSTYNHSDCLEKFPFPLCGEAEKARIRDIAEQLDAHRKRVQAQHSHLTLTGMYNVLEKLRAATTAARAASGAHHRGWGGPVVSVATLPSPPANSSQASGLKPATALTLTDKERRIHDDGLVSVLKQLHDDLDAAVFAAYGWPSDLTDADILQRLVTLNAQRAEEEKQGIIHWLRPDYQRSKEQGGKSTEHGAESIEELPLKPKKAAKPKTAPQPRAPGTKPTKQPWPKSLAERIRAVEQALHTTSPTTADALSLSFARAKPTDVQEILESLVALGRARREGESFSV